MKDFKFAPWSVPPALLAVCLLAYSLLTPTLGLYWDDFPFTWISRQLGDEALARYFHTNRPFYGMLYTLTSHLLGAAPWRWQLFGVFWRWASAVVLWALLRSAWRKQEGPALAASLLYAVYPGAVQQFISVVFSHFFLVLTALFASFICSIQAARRGFASRAAWLWTAGGLLLALLNLLPLEYFYLLELTRPLFLWAALDGTSRGRERLGRTLLHSAPYLLLFTLVTLWRAFFFSYQTQNYQPTLLKDLVTAPLQALTNLGASALRSLWAVSFQAWALPFQLPDSTVLGGRTTLVWAALSALSFGALVFFLLRQRPAGDSGRRPALQLLLAGTAGMLLAGVPYWAVGLAVNLGFPSNRLTLSFMPGVSIFLAGLLFALPLPRAARSLLLALAVSLGVGLQFQNANAFRRDWNTQNALFWQMAWRMPALEKGTALFINELPVRFYTDNSLTAALNWVFDPAAGDETMHYYLLYPSLRMGEGLPGLQKGIPIHRDYLAARFAGNTSQAVALWFQPPGCLRVLDPDLDSVNGMIPPLMREAALLTDTFFIQDAAPSQAARPPSRLYPQEPDHGWCYAYQKADLARQSGDWEAVLRIAEEAAVLNDHPNDPMERVPFIEAFAHTGRWDQAVQETLETARVTPLMQPVLCRLWQRIEAQTPVSAQKDAAVLDLRGALSCESAP